MLGVGWQVGNYIVEDPAGFARGTFGTLYVARRAADDARVAMKLVLMTNEPDSRERLEAERHGAMLQQRFELAHGMVPEVYEYGPYNEHLYIAMEFVEGRSLTELIRSGMTAAEAARAASGICEFLDKAHQFATTIEGVCYDRIVHADLKPDHVLVAESGGMKVLDFGIAKALEKTTEVTTNNWSTVAYASPERLQSGGHVNVHADFWSLGVILYEMISGHLPYPALAPRHMRSQLEQAIRTNARPEPLPLSCPPHLAAIVSKLMAHQVEHRYSTASAIRADLERFLSGERPLAFEQYETPATVPVLRSGTEARPTRSTAPPVPSVHVVPATEPFPVAPAAAVPSHPAAAAPKVRRAYVRPFLVAVATRGMWALLLMFVVGTIATEGGAWVASVRFRQGLDELEGRTLAERRQEYENIRRWGTFDIGLRSLVDLPLRARLVALADAVIADYRRDDPAMSSTDWRQANEALKWALTLSQGDSRILARQRMAEGHLARIAARAQRRGTEAARQGYLASIAQFEEAAKLDGESFDPYLGISSVQSYGLNEVDRAAEAIEQAERRGYVPGRRERALMGDGYLRRADRTRRRARQLDEEPERAELVKALADYERCVERFEPIQDFGRSRQNLQYCRGHRDRISEELDAAIQTPVVM